MTQEEIIEMAREAGIIHPEMVAKHLVAFAHLVAAKEREACAKIVEDSPSYDWHKFACEAAAAIRARGEQA
jgi:hypothetical protein